MTSIDDDALLDLDKSIKDLVDIFVERDKKDLLEQQALQKKEQQDLLDQKKIDDELKEQKKIDQQRLDDDYQLFMEQSQESQDEQVNYLQHISYSNHDIKLLLDDLVQQRELSHINDSAVNFYLAVVIPIVFILYIIYKMINFFID